jgi:phosphodiesterase/alkaline phosphatase D-like protein
MENNMELSRRGVLASGAVLAAGGVVASPSQAAAADPIKPVFQSTWHDEPDRPWLGADYWAAPLQDWRVVDGAAECANAAPNRIVHLLTADLADRRGGFTMSVKVRRADGKKFGEGKGSVGFRVGIRGPLGDYRNALLFGKGIDVGLAADGTVLIGKHRDKVDLPELLDQKELALRVYAYQVDGGGYGLGVMISSPTMSGSFSSTATDFGANDFVGNVALVANFGGPEPGGPKKKQAAKKTADDGPNYGAATFRFSDWTISGDKVDVHPNRAFGPVLFTQYTLSGGTLKLTAQMPPLGETDDKTATLVVGDRRVEADIHPAARTATFRIDDYAAKQDAAYRVEYQLKSKSGAARTDVFPGVIRREPLDKPELVVADVSCNIHAAFPNDRYVEHMKKVDPDFLAFVGDQFYESTAGYGVTTTPLDAAILDYLRKWYCHGWTWRELMRDRPSIAIPDDHDVYQGNLWGENGAPQKTTQEAGGYRMPGAWVNVVHHTQTSHHPDAYDKSPTEQGITQYFGRLVYGGVDFAILADRQYKIGPEGVVPATGGRGDHVTDPNFDPKTADLPDLPLLGASQEKFLAEWADDWSAGKVKAVVSQTIFTAMATTHGGPNGRLIADYDTNGWPQTARNRAVKLIRKACAFHLAGDQHLPALVQYGVDAPRDGSYAFAGPAVNVGYPRWWEPQKAGAHSLSGGDELVGDFLDAFGNHLHVVAFANGAKQPRQGVLEFLTDKTSGIGIVRFDKPARKVTVECWPFDVDPTAEGAKQFAGWPVTIDLPSPLV